MSKNPIKFVDDIRQHEKGRFVMFKHILELHPHWVDASNLVMLAHDPSEAINFRRFTTESIEQAAVKLAEQRQRLVAGFIGLEDQRERLQLCSIQLQECRDETRRRAAAFEFLTSSLRS